MEIKTEVIKRIYLLVPFLDSEGNLSGHKECITKHPLAGVAFYSGGGVMNILMVDPTPYSREVLNPLLRNSGKNHVLYLPSLEQLLIKNEDWVTGIDLVVYNEVEDLFRGLDLARGLNTMPGWEHIPVILLMETGSIESINPSIWLPVIMLARPVEEVGFLTVVSLAERLRAEMCKCAELEKDIQGLRGEVESFRISSDRNVSDPLTGLPAQRQLEEALDREWKRSLREERPLSLIFLSIDDYEAYVHLNGEEDARRCLSTVGQLLREEINRPGDLVARYGKNDFAILLPESDSLGATVLAEILRSRVAASRIPHTGSDVAAYVTVSLGLACSHSLSRMQPAALIMDAYRSLLMARSQGGNQVGKQS